MKIFNMFRLVFLSLLITFIGHSASYCADDELTPLGEQMEQIGRAWRMVKRGAGDSAKNPQTLEHVRTMQVALDKAMQYTPARLEDIPDANRKKFLGDYYKGLKDFQDSLEKLEALIQAGDNTAASELVKKIDDHREASHEAFRRPE